MRRLILTAALLLAVTALPAGVAGADDPGACGDPYTPIYDIQGTGYSSPFTGEWVVTEGIVTVDLQKGSELGGFFVQDPNGDGKVRTSDGVFVYHKDYYAYDVSVGDYIRFEAKVSEYYGQTQLGSIYEGDLTYCGTGEIEPTALPVRKFTRRGESYEGMYVTFPARLRVTDTYNHQKYGEVFLTQAGVAETPTNQYAPGLKADQFAERNMRKVVLLDDGSGYSYPDPIPFLREGDTLRLGDSVRGLTGAVGYGYSKYRIQPDGDVNFSPNNRRKDAPKVGGDLVVGSANVLNYWSTIGCGYPCRGAQTQEQLDIQTDKLVAEILGMGADIMALQEIENTGTDGIVTHDAIEALVTALNTAEGDEVWFWDGPATHYNAYPIRNEIIYRSTEANPITAMWASPIALADDAFDRVRPGDTDPVGRPPLAQMFEYDGEQFILVVNHFKSKGSACDSIGDPDLGDGQGNCNLTRVAQSEALLEFVDDLATESGEPDVLVVGDLNSYLMEDPVLVLETGLTNLVTMWNSNPYSYNYFNWRDKPWIGRGLLDHALATASMADQVTKTKVWHINADEPRFLDWYDTSVVGPGPYRASDHDPVIIGLDLG